MNKCPVRIDQASGHYIVYVIRPEGYEANVFDGFAEMMDFLFDYFGVKKAES